VHCFMWSVVRGRIFVTIYLAEPSWSPDAIYGIWPPGFFFSFQRRRFKKKILNQHIVVRGLKTFFAISRFFSERS